MRFVKMVIEAVVALLFPLRCPICDGIVKEAGERVCLDCLKKIKLLSAPWCMKCGKGLMIQGCLCEDCKNREHSFIRGRALFEYQSVAKAIYRFKYGGRCEYAYFFGEEMVRFLGEFIRGCEPDGLIPIPLYKKKEKKRGYNQSLLLAKVIGSSLKIPVYDHLLVREKDTVPLKSLNPRERQNNLKKAFNIAENDVKLKSVIIVDDIYTTGSTMDEAAAVLHQWGVEKVFFVTIATGEGI